MNAALPPYFLSKNAYVCVSNDRVVMLDLQRGDYLAIEMSDARALGGWVRDWPIPGAPTAKPEVLENLLTEGLLTADGAHGRDGPLVPRVITPSASLYDSIDFRRVRIRAHHVCRFLLAITLSACLLRWMPMRHIISQVRARKARSGAFDLDRARSLIAVYDALYVCFFDRKDECLRNSFFLLSFLAQYGLYPDWVFGVRPTPFLAHCWLQYEGLVLNDTIRSTACLSPILVI